MFCYAAEQIASSLLLTIMPTHLAYQCSSAPYPKPLPAIMKTKTAMDVIYSYLGYVAADQTLTETPSPVLVSQTIMITTTFSKEMYGMCFIFS